MDTDLVGNVFLLLSYNNGMSHIVKLEKNVGTLYHRTAEHKPARHLH